MEFPARWRDLRERRSPNLPPRDPAPLGRNVMMIEALDGVSWSPAYACPFSETGPRKSEDGWTNVTTAIPARQTLRPREAVTS